MPGTPFCTFEQAVLAFAINFNDNAIRHNVEYGATIFSYRDDRGRKVYSYTLVFRSETNKSSYVPPAPPGTETAGFAHMHAAYTPDKFDPKLYPDWNVQTGTGYPDDFFSSIDKDLVRSAYRILDPGFRGVLICSDGTIKEYDPVTESTFAWYWNPYIPSDPGRADRKTRVPVDKEQLQHMPDEREWVIRLAQLPGMRLPDLSIERRMLFDPGRVKQER